MSETKYSFINGVPIDPGEGWEIVPWSDIMEVGKTEFSEDGVLWNPSTFSWGSWTPAALTFRNPSILAFRRPIQALRKEGDEKCAIKSDATARNAAPFAVASNAGEDTNPAALKEAGAGSLEKEHIEQVRLTKVWLESLPKSGITPQSISEWHVRETDNLRTLAKEQGEALEEAESIRKHITHPQIHVDYYEWLGGLTDFDRNFLKTASPTGIAMWAWSLSRERLILIAKVKAKVGE